MPKTATIRLGETDYIVRAFNVGELEQVLELSDTLSRAKMPFAILRLALRVAVPPVASETLDATPIQIGIAVDTILELSGLKSADPLSEKPLPPATVEGPTT